MRAEAIAARANSLAKRFQRWAEGHWQCEPSVAMGPWLKILRADNSVPISVTPPWATRNPRVATDIDPSSGSARNYRPEINVRYLCDRKLFENFGLRSTGLRGCMYRCCNKQRRRDQSPQRPNSTIFPMPRLSLEIANLCQTSMVNKGERTKMGAEALRNPGDALCAMVMNDVAIHVENVTKIYKGAVRALDNVSLAVMRGTIFGLLGPNGAGKSTLINILAGLVNKTGGSASIWGFDIDRDPRNAKASIGIVNQEITFDPFFTPAETLDIQAGLYGVSKSAKRTMELLKAVRLEDKADAYARTLSGGMKRRLMVAKAMVHSPPVLVLDEPTAGVDIDLRRQLWDYVRELHARGVTIVLTTHYLEEAEDLCDHIAIINHGKLIADKPTRELINMAQEKAVVVTVERDIEAAPDTAAFEKVKQIDARTLSITYRKDIVNAGDVLSALGEAGHNIVDVSTREADLEDVFLNLTQDAT